MTSRRVTIQDVAEMAGVSAQTVSRVVNQKPDVAEATRDRVLQAVQRLGYRPSAIARSLVSHRTHTLGIISSPLSDQFRADVVVATESEARRRGYACILTFTDGTIASAQRMCHLLHDRQVDGLVLITPSAVPEEAIDIHLPAVALAYPVLNGLAINVDVDNVDGGYQAVNHLTSLGHRRIGVVAGPAGWRAAADRTEGARRALATVGRALEDDGVEVAADWTLEAGYAASRALLDRRAGATALFCQNDLLALGAYRLLAERGLRVPADVSVVGYDDLPICSFAAPALTSVRQPRASLGQLITQLLIDAVEQQAHSGQDVQVRAELVVRESTAAPQPD